MRFGPRGNCVQQQLQSVIRLDVGEIGAVGTQVAKERCIVCVDTLTNDRNAKPAHRDRLGRFRGLQTIAVDDRSLAKAIQLVSRPKVGR